MKRIRSLRAMGIIAAIALTLALVVASCGGTESSRLRITNNGGAPVEGLVVLFPEEEVVFGDVAPGETTDWEAVSEGVYRYAAYRFKVDGQEVTQPVIDWVGEEPMPGDAFTYVIDYDPTREPIQQVQLVNVIEED